MLRSILTALLAVGGCAAPAPDVPEPLGAPVRIPLGETRDLLGVAVRFDAIVEDGRCPKGANCVVPGRARVRLLLNGTPTVLTIPQGPRSPGDQSAEFVNGVTVEVLDLHPYPSVLDRTGAPEPFEVEVTAQRNDA